MTGGTFSGRAATTGAGFVLLRMLQVVQISMTVSVTLAEFEDGSTLVNNVATLLQIDPSRIKIVSVQSRDQVAAGGRRLQSSGLSVIFQIVEENPEPIPGEAFADSGVEPPPGVVWTITTSSGSTSGDAENETETENSTGSGSEASYSFSSEALEELKQLAQVLQDAADSGDLSVLLEMPVVLEAIDTTDPTLPAAVEEPQEEPDADDAPAPAKQPAIGEDESYIPVLVGGIVGTIIGAVMMGIFIYVKNKYYAANQVSAAPENVDEESPQNQENFRDLGSNPDDPQQPEP